LSAPPSPQRLPPHLVDFLEGGVSLLLATCDASGAPECVRAAGVTVSAERTRVTVLLSERVAARTLANLTAGSTVALTVSRPIDHSTIQLKGRALGTRPAEPGERAIADRYLASFTEALYLVGMTRAVVRRFAVWPAIAVEIELAELFEQTPGPTAGARLVEARR
jgi:hypothetical protein